MQLAEVLTTTGTCRRFTADPVPDDVLHRAFDLARFAPQGGNRQPVRWVVVRDPATRARLAELYLPIWRDYLGVRATGGMSRVLREADHFAAHLAEVPVLVVVCAEQAALHPTDHELGRVSIVGGASVYPAVYALLLALREQGLGAALTTLLCREEPAVRELLGIPEGFITAAHVAVGRPERPFPTTLTRAPVADVVYAERFDHPLFSG